MDDHFSEKEISLHNPHFYARAFTSLVQELKSFPQKDNLKKIFTEEYDELSRRLDRAVIQDSCAVRNVLISRRIANLLISDLGEINTNLLPKLISHLTENLYSLGPERQHDAKRKEHILKVLNNLRENKETVRLLKNVSKPIGHSQAEQIIRDSMQLPPGTLLTDAAARRAVLSSWLCYLRQSVGSCFATAPAIIIHNEQAELYLKDVNELLSTGRLKRTFGGVEYIVPLSFSWGAGDLRKRFILKRDLSYFSVEIWQSPGLINALKAVEVIENDLSPKKSRHRLKELIQNMLNSWEQPGELCVVTAEIILRKILLNHHQLTEQDVEDYLNRPQGMIHSSLLIQVPKAAAIAGGKGGSTSQFLHDFERAKNTFKSLADHALLKAWEFSLASFCDIKTDFSRWNLYSSLGLGADEPGGIGRCIYEVVQHKLNLSNAKVAEFQSEYEQIFTQVKYLESRVRNASTEKEAQWMRVEYQSKLQEFYLFEEMRNKANAKARLISEMFQALIDMYLALFPSYFQEVYDADMQDVTSGQYDDSPAGFRLLYKHGRANTSQWTKISNPNEFIQSLSAFFVATENEIASDSRFRGLGEELSEIVTRVINHIKTTEFLESAFHRMAIYHKVPSIRNPLENLDRIEKKPWAYTSGGTMDTLLSCYYRREQKPSQVSRWMESVTELLVFLFDTLKQIPYKETQIFLSETEKSLLMHSPTHAFLLKPGYHLFKEGWQTDAYTYVWARDQLILPMTKFVESLRLDEQMMRRVIDEIKGRIPQDFHHRFVNVFEHFPVPSMNTIDFRKYVIEKMTYDPGLKGLLHHLISEEEIDSELFTLLPMFPNHLLEAKITAVFANLPGITGKTKEKALELFERYFSSLSSPQIITAKELQDVTKTLLCLALEKTSTKYNYHKEVSKTVQNLGFAMPKPIFFADTNWMRDYFGFVINPGTGKLDLWRLDNLGISGIPMRDWQKWWDGSRRDVTWGVYTRPHEYQG